MTLKNLIIWLSTFSVQFRYLRIIFLSRQFTNQNTYIWLAVIILFCTTNYLRTKLIPNSLFILPSLYFLNIIFHTPPPPQKKKENRKNNFYRTPVIFFCTYTICFFSCFGHMSLYLTSTRALKHGNISLFNEFSICVKTCQLNLAVSH